MRGNGSTLADMLDFGMTRSLRLAVSPLHGVTRPTMFTCAGMKRWHTSCGEHRGENERHVGADKLHCPIGVPERGPGISTNIVLDLTNIRLNSTNSGPESTDRFRDQPSLSRVRSMWGDIDQLGPDLARERPILARTRPHTGPDFGRIRATPGDERTIILACCIEQHSVGSQEKVLCRALVMGSVLPGKLGGARPKVGPTMWWLRLPLCMSHF